MVHYTLQNYLVPKPIKLDSTSLLTQKPYDHTMLIFDDFKSIGELTGYLDNPILVAVTIRPQWNRMRYREKYRN